MSNGYLGCSRDGIVYDTSIGEQGILEIKRPSSAAETSLEEVASVSSHFCAKFVDGKLYLKKSHLYHFQVQGNMGITKLKLCDFVLWAPSGISVERIFFDEELWASMLAKLQHFFCHWLLPEMLLKRCKEGMDIEEVLYWDYLFFQMDVDTWEVSSIHFNTKSLRHCSPV